MKIIDQIRGLVKDLNPSQFRLSRDSMAQLLSELNEDALRLGFFKLASRLLEERAEAAEKLVSDMRSADRNRIEQTDKIIAQLEAENANLLRMAKNNSRENSILANAIRDGGFELLNSLPDGSTLYLRRARNAK